MELRKIKYDELNGHAQKMYNFQKVSSKLADYGFTIMWLNNYVPIWFPSKEKDYKHDEKNC